MASVDPISTAINAAATIASVVSNISDANKRRLIESNLSLMSEKEKIELANKIASQNNRNDQATILINTVLAARNANADREQRAQTIKWILIGALGLGTIVTIAWYYKK